jgi:hypothetical protein
MKVFIEEGKKLAEKPEFKKIGLPIAFGMS